MIFSIILISIFLVGFVITGIVYHKMEDMIDNPYIFIVCVLSFFGMVASTIFLICGSVNKREVLNRYKYYKVNPQYVTYNQLAEINKEIIDINTYKGTIFSFYNGTDLELFDIDNVSNKIIIQ